MSKNKTSVAEFLLLGFPQIKGYKTYCVFFFILLIYLLTLAVNFLIIGLVISKRKLHTPMYFLIQHLSIVEIAFLTVIIPNMLHVIWLEGATIPYLNCIAQTYFYAAIGCAECHLLAVMSYDRFLAICNPLRYSSIMNNILPYLLIYCWVAGFLLTMVTPIILSQIQFCESNVMDHFFCDHIPFVKLSCSHIFAFQVIIIVFSFPIMVVPFILVIVSYSFVFKTILGISSSTGRKKAFSTCSSHLIVVTMYYGTLFCIYLVPANGQELALNKVLSLLYTVVTPLFNPIIYSLRNQEIRSILANLFKDGHKLT